MKYKKNGHLFEDGTYIEFSVNNNYRSYGFQQIPDSATAQLFDISSDFNQINQLSESKLSPEIRSFQTTQNQSKFQKCLNNIPVFHPTSRSLIIWQFFMVIIIFLYFFYIPLKIHQKQKIHSI